ncbi:hypothetical protein CPC08DRAFT_701695 [Agrocybe pediades]|nr:hypothetical protein CPC08DRAFT_701695 [Agrocybe pediades]
MDDVFSSTDLSSDEITWLHASALLSEPPAPPPKDDDFLMEDVSSFRGSLLSQKRPLSFTARDSPRRTASLMTTPRSSDNSPRSEWIYRRPKTPPSSKHASSTSDGNFSSAGYRSLSRSGTSTSVRTTISSSRISLNQDVTPSTPSSSSGPFWTTLLRTRSRSERSVPLLKTIPSQSLITLTDPVVTSAPTTPQKRPRGMSTRPPSTSSTLSSASNSPTSSLSESPVTPVSLFSYEGGVCGNKHRRQNPYSRRHRKPRESSVSTKDSSHTVNKSVKFAAAPVVHYAGEGYWNVDTVEGIVDEDNGMGINLDSMDIEDESSYRGEDLLTLAKLREMQCATPTPEREKAKGLKRLMSLSAKKALPVIGTSQAAVPPARKPRRSQKGLASPRPVISTPYPLGTHPPSHAMQESTTSLRAPGQWSRASDAAGSTSDFSFRNSLPIRTAPSCESLRSAKSAAARSVRSLGSLKSTASSRGIKAWLGRTMGWVEG